MCQNWYLSSPESQRLYDQVKDCPIYDYHCHLSPKEILDDAPFSDLGELWLSGDHYKWRLMRAVGIEEERITGSASWGDKLSAYFEALALSPGNPLFVWSQMELRLFFGIDLPPLPIHANAIREKANRVIRERELSPRKLIRQSNVAYIGTTDNPADSLASHEALSADPAFEIRVAPTFRLDSVLLPSQPAWKESLHLLGHAAGLSIRSLDGLKEALRNRLDYFAAHGCRFADVGLPFFPHGPTDSLKAQHALDAALSGEVPLPEDYHAFLLEMYLFLGQEFRRRGIIWQLHLAVQRNASTRLLSLCGPDCGGDCIGDPIPGSQIAFLLNELEKRGSLPRMILYALNPAMLTQLATIAGSFPDVRVGAAWWFLDHRRGIEETLRTIAETGPVGVFPGMLTDSRSFLSYARHDYFRRILCDLLVRWAEDGEFAGDLLPLAKAVCFENIKKWIESDL